MSVTPNSKLGLGYSAREVSKLHKTLSVAGKELGLSGSEKR